MKKSETMSFGFKRKPDGSNMNVGMVRSKTVLDPVSELIPLEDLSIGGTSDLDRLGNTGTAVSYQNDSCLSSPKPPSSYDGRREQEGCSHFDETQSF